MAYWDPLEQRWKPDANDLFGTGGNGQILTQNPNAKVAPAAPRNQGTIGIAPRQSAPQVRVVKQTPQQQIGALLNTQLQQQIQAQNQRYKNPAQDAINTLLGQPNPLDLFNIGKGTPLYIQKPGLGAELERIRKVNRQGYGADDFVNMLLKTERIRRSKELQQQSPDKLSPPGTEYDKPFIIGETDEQKKAREAGEKSQQEENDRIQKELDAQVEKADKEIRDALKNPNDARSAQQITDEAYGRVDPQAIIKAASRDVEKERVASQNAKARRQEELKGPQGRGILSTLGGFITDPGTALGNIMGGNINSLIDRHAAGQLMKEVDDLNQRAREAFAKGDKELGKSLKNQAESKLSGAGSYQRTMQENSTGLGRTAAGSLPFLASVLGGAAVGKSAGAIGEKAVLGRQAIQQSPTRAAGQFIGGTAKALPITTFAGGALGAAGAYGNKQNVLEGALGGAVAGAAFAPLGGLASLRPRSGVNINLLEGMQTRGLTSPAISSTGMSLSGGAIPPQAANRGVNQFLSGTARPLDRTPGINLLEGMVGKPKGALSMGDRFYHATTPEAAASILSKGFRGQVGDRSRGATKGKGTFFYKNDEEAANAFGKNFARNNQESEVVTARIEGKIFNALKDDRGIRELAEDKKLISRLRKEGYVGIDGDEMGQAVTFVFDTKAAKPVSSANPNLRNLPIPTQESAAFGSRDVQPMVNRGVPMKPGATTPRAETPNINLLGKPAAQDQSLFNQLIAESRNQRVVEESAKQGYKELGKETEPVPQGTPRENSLVNVTTGEGVELPEAVAPPGSRLQTRAKVDDILENTKVKGKGGGSFFKDPRDAYRDFFGTDSQAMKDLESSSKEFNAQKKLDANTANKAFQKGLKRIGISGKTERQAVSGFSRKQGIYGTEEKLLARFSPEKVEQIKAAAEYQRKVTDAAIQALNNAADAYGFPKVEYRQNYAPEPPVPTLVERIFGRQQAGGVIDAGANRNVVANEPSSFFRKSKEGFREGDILRDMSAFNESLYADLHGMRHAAKVQEYAKALKEKELGNEKIFATLDRVASEALGVDAGPTAALERAWGPRQVIAVSRSLTFLNSLSTLGGNLTSIWAQATNAFLTAGQTALQPRAIAKLFSNGLQREIQLGDLPTAQARYTRYHRPVKSAGEHTADAMFVGMMKAEQAFSRATTRMLEAQGKARGLKDESLKAWVDDQFRARIGSREAGEEAGITSNPVLKPFTQFTSEVQNQFVYLMKEARSPQDFLGASLGLFVWNQLSEQVIGRKVSIDPAQAMIDAGKLVKEGKYAEAAGRIAGEVASNVAGGQAIAQLFPKEFRKKYFGSTDIGRFTESGPIAGLDPFRKLLQDPSKQTALNAGLFFVPGSNQLRKTVQGIDMLKTGEYKSQKGQVLGVDVDTSPTAKLQTVLFGRSANPGVRDYFNTVEETGNFPVTDRQLQGVKERIAELKAAAGPGAKDINLSDSEIEHLARITDDNSKETVSSKEKLQALISGDSEQIRQAFGNDEKYAQRLAAQFSDPDGKSAATKLLQLQSSGDKVQQKQYELDQKYQNGDIGSAEYNIKKVKNSDEAIDQAIFTPDSLSQKDIAYLRSASDKEVAAYLRSLRAQGRNEEADFVSQDLINYSNTAAQRGSQRYSNEFERITFQDKVRGQALQSLVPEEAVALASASKQDLQRALASNPGLAQYIPQAVQLTQNKVLQDLITASSGKSTIKRLTAASTGNFGSSSGGGGGKKGRKGRKGGSKKGGKVTVKKGRGKKASIKAPKTRSNYLNTLLAPPKRGQTFEQILRQLR